MINKGLIERARDFSFLADRLNGQTISRFLYSVNVAPELLCQLRHAVKVYISKCLKLEGVVMEEEHLVKELVEQRHQLSNLTPNGNLVPKKPFALEYNLLAKSYANLLMSFGVDDLIENIHFPFNVRIKYGDASAENLLRGRHPTEAMHLDAWTGANPQWVFLHLFVLGDIPRNHIRYADPTESFDERWIRPLRSVRDWPDSDNSHSLIDFVPSNNTVVIGDGSVFHQSYREEGAGVRVSIDTGFDLHRLATYVDHDAVVGGESVRDIRVGETLSVEEFFSIGEKVYFHFPDDVAERVDTGIGLRHPATVRRIALE